MPCGISGEHEDPWYGNTPYAQELVWDPYPPIQPSLLGCTLQDEPRLDNRLRMSPCEAQRAFLNSRHRLQKCTWKRHDAARNKTPTRREQPSPVPLSEAAFRYCRRNSAKNNILRSMTKWNDLPLQEDCIPRCNPPKSFYSKAHFKLQSSSQTARQIGKIFLR